MRELIIKVTKFLIRLPIYIMFSPLIAMFYLAEFVDKILVWAFND